MCAASCDTFVVLSDCTADGSVIFGKNSDRDPNEAQELLRMPRLTHPAGATVHCTYKTIPQVPVTWEVLLSKPHHMWGAEMGANEHGLAAGNEALFARVPVPRGSVDPTTQDDRYLTGMDLVRLALERASSARQAVDVVAALLREHGQGGDCGHDIPIFYHNAFLFADRSEAWVMETVGREWAAQRVTSGVRSISNAFSIRTQWDLCSDGLVASAVQAGLCRSAADFDMARCFSAGLYTWACSGCERQRRTEQRLREAARGPERVLVTDAFDVLRDHGIRGKRSPGDGFLGADVCMHFGPLLPRWLHEGAVRRSQTTSSMVSHLHPNLVRPRAPLCAAACSRSSLTPPCTLLRPPWASRPRTGAPAPPHPACRCSSQCGWRRATALGHRPRVCLTAALCGGSTRCWRAT